MLSAGRRSRRLSEGTLTAADSADGVSYAHKGPAVSRRLPANGYVRRGCGARVCVGCMCVGCVRKWLMWYTRLNSIDRKGASLAATVLLLLLLSLLLLLLLLPLLQFVFLLELLLLLLLLMLLLLLVGACHPSDTVPPVRVANLHMRKTAA